MSSVSLCIKPAANNIDFNVILTENGNSVSEKLLAAELTCDIGAGPQQLQDILVHVATADTLARQDAPFQKIAEALYDWLFPIGPLRNRWDALRAVEQPSITIDVSTVSEFLLAHLPWEMACSPAPHVRLSASAVQRFEKFAERGIRCSPWPLRILFVVGCSKQDEKRLGIDHELKQVERAFLKKGRSVDVLSLHRPTRDQLQEKVRTYHPHVFHFAGHGGVHPQSNAPGLRFDLHPNGWIWHTADIPNDMVAWKWIPKFVFLNACRSGVDAQALWSVQRTFLAAGTESAIGMQADIGGDMAGRFAATAYLQCADGATVGEAVFEGRLKLQSDAWIPVLFTSSTSDLKLFQPTPLPANPAFQQCVEFEDAKVFANCHEGRREFTYWLSPPIPPPPVRPVRNVAFLEGPRKSGKSHLLKWCMETWALAGVEVRYIEIHNGTAKTFLSVLRQIRDGDSDATLERELLHSGLPETAFRRFNWELKNLIATGQSGEWKDSQNSKPNVGDAGEPLAPRGEKRIEDKICASFLSALKLAAETNPLVLVFDKLDGPQDERLMPVSEFEHLVKHLFDPIARDPTSRIKLVFVLNPVQQNAFGLNALPGANVLKWRLPVEYPNDQMASLAAEMLWFQEETKVKQIAQKMLSLDADEGTPVGLGFLKLVYDYIFSRKPEILAGVERMQ